MVCKSVEEVLKRNKSSDLEVSGQALIIGAAARAFLRRRQILRSDTGWRDICEGSDTNNETDPSQTTHQRAYFAQDLKLFRGQTNVCAAALIGTAGLTRSQFD